MNYSNKLDLRLVFKLCASQEYAVVKCPQEFPNYYSGSDIDIFCGNIDAFTRALASSISTLLREGITLKVTSKPQQYHVDFVIDDKLDFRFDLYGALPSYDKVRLKPSLFYAVLDARQGNRIQAGADEYMFYTACARHELLLRYVEYLEWYERREDKIKHIDHILSHPENSRSEFIGLLHRYTELPACTTGKYGLFKRLTQYYSKNISFYYLRIRDKGMLGSIQALARRLGKRGRN